MIKKTLCDTGCSVLVKTELRKKKKKKQSLKAVEISSAFQFGNKKWKYKSEIAIKFE